MRIPEHQKELFSMFSGSVVSSGMLSFVISILLVGVMPAAHAEWQEWITDVDIKYVDHDNINYSAFSNDELSDSAVIPMVSFGRYKQLSDTTRLRLTADIEAGKFDKFDKLDYNQIGITAAVRHKLGLGPKAQWIRGHIMAATLNVDSNIRDDSTIYEVGVKTGKRFTSRFDGEIGLAYRTRDGKNDNPVVNPAIPTDVFDQDSTTLSLGGNYLLGENSSLSFGYSYRDGEFDSACTGPNVGTVLAVEKVKAITFDDAFNLTVPMCVYKLEGKTNTHSLSVNFAVGRQASLRIGLERQDGKGDVLDYENTIARIGFVYLH